MAPTARLVWTSFPGHAVRRGQARGTLGIERDSYSPSSGRARGQAGGGPYVARFV
jgi:hypothetical protein